MAEARLLLSRPSLIGRAGCRSSLQGPISSRGRLPAAWQALGFAWSLFPGWWNTVCPEQRKVCTHGCLAEITLFLTWPLRQVSALPDSWISFSPITLQCRWSDSGNAALALGSDPLALPGGTHRRDPAFTAALVHRSASVPLRSPASPALPAPLAPKEAVKAKARGQRPSLRYRADNSAWMPTWYFSSFFLHQMEAKTHL